MKKTSKNYITPNGFKKLQAEFSELFFKERPRVVETVAWAASNGDRSENGDYIYGKRRLRQIDSRLRHLRNRIESAEVVNPANQESDRVLFGSTVSFEDENGSRKTYQIVGEDEIEPGENMISWKSPVAKALLGKALGDVVVLKRPKGDLEVEVTHIAYHPQEIVDELKDIDLPSVDEEN